MRHARGFFLFLSFVLVLVACGPAPAPEPAGTGEAGVPGATEDERETAFSTGAGEGPTAAASQAVTPGNIDDSSTQSGVSDDETRPVAGPTPAAIEPRTLTALGDPAAAVTIVEYSDYQCPFCRRHFQQTMPQIKSDYIDTGRVYYVFKDFPIATLHPMAYRLHEAALCVGDAANSEAYWQVHDLFFAEAEQFQKNSEEAMDATILQALEAEGLPDVSDCLQDGQFTETVQAGVAEGQMLGLNATPSFFINGYPLVGAQPYDVFQYAISLAESGELEDAFRQAAGEQAAAQATATAQAAQPADVPLGDAPVKGDPDAPVTIVEYSDFQCPFCLRHFRQTMPQLESYIEAGQVRYVFKDFPIARTHPQAPKAHEASRCARELGGDDAFWKMHDLLFANQETWAGNPNHVDVFKSLAPDAGLPQDDFNSCLDGGRYAEAVNADLVEGQQLGVTGTPTFFINGQRLVGAQPFSAFRQVIEQALKAPQ